MWYFSLRTHVWLRMGKLTYLLFKYCFSVIFYVLFLWNSFEGMLEPWLIILFLNDTCIFYIFLAPHAMFWINFSFLSSHSLILFSVLSSLEFNQYIDFISFDYVPMGFPLPTPDYLFLFDICLFLFHNFLLFIKITPVISLRALIVFIVTQIIICFTFISSQVNSSTDLDCWLTCLSLLSLQSSLHVYQLKSLVLQWHWMIY